MMSIKNIIQYIFSLYIILLPIDSALSGTILPFSPINIVGIILILSLLVSIFFRYNSLRMNKFALILLFIWVLILSSSILAKTLNYPSSLIILTYSLMFILFLITNDQFNETFFHTRIIFSALIYAVIFLANFSFPNYRFTMTFGNIVDPNFAASSLIAIAGVTLYGALFQKNIIEIIIYFFILFAILITGSRTALLSIIGMSIIQIAYTKSKAIYRIFLIGILGVLLFQTFINIIDSEILRRFYLSNFQDGSGRLKIWENYFLIFKDSGIIQKLLGFGLSNSSNIYGRHFGYVKNAHNVYISLLFDLGVIGFLTIISMQMYMIIKLIKKSDVLGISIYLGLIISSLFLDMQITRYFWFINFYCYMRLKNKLRFKSTVKKMNIG